MGKKATGMIETYINFLNNIVKWLSDIESRKKWIINNRGKALLFIYIAIALGSAGELWMVGYCIDCDSITPKQIEEIKVEFFPPTSSMEEFAKLIENKTFVPYESWTKYGEDYLMLMAVRTGLYIFVLSSLYIVIKTLHYVLANLIFKKYNKLK